LIACRRAGLESLVEVEADVVTPGATIKGCTQRDVELAIRHIAITSRPVKQLPFTIEEASRLHNFDPHSQDSLVNKIEAKIAAAQDALEQSLSICHPNTQQHNDTHDTHDTHTTHTATHTTHRWLVIG
jgi:hypothetical protein